MIQSAFSFPPPLILMCSAVICLAGVRVVRLRRVWGPIGFLAILCAGVLLAQTDSPSIDEFGLKLTAVLLFLGGTLNLCMWRPPIGERSPGLRQAVLLSGIAAAITTATADHLLTILLAMEFCGLASAAMIWTTQATLAPVTLARRSLSLQAVSLGLVLTAFALLFWRTESLRVSDVQESFVLALQTSRTTGLPMPHSAIDRLTMALLFSGLGMRLFLVPFHFGQSEILTDADQHAFGFLTLIARSAAAIVLFRVAFQTMSGSPTAGVVLAAVLASLTMLIGTTLAIGRNTLRETMALLAIGQGGIVLAGLAATWGHRANSVIGSAAMMPLLRGEAASALSAVVLLLSFAGLLALLESQRRNGRPVEFVDELRGLFRDRPLVAAGIAVLLLNLVGIPPLPGFWSRISTWAALLAVIRDNGDGVVHWHPALLVTAVIVGIQSILTAVIALRVIGVMIFEQPVSVSRSDRNWPALFGGVTCAVLTILIGLSPTRTLRKLDAIIPALPVNKRPARGGGGNGVESAEVTSPFERCG